ncbi:MAG: hypothetical protein LBF59_07805 [Prevotellaceae bacterium]|nr:hypothetical protein [Prevotellaceae bacterium]
MRKDFRHIVETFNRLSLDLRHIVETFNWLSLDLRHIVETSNRLSLAYCQSISHKATMFSDLML